MYLIPTRRPGLGIIMAPANGGIRRPSPAPIVFRPVTQPPPPATVFSAPAQITVPRPLPIVNVPPVYGLPQPALPVGVPVRIGPALPPPGTIIDGVVPAPTPTPPPASTTTTTTAPGGAPAQNVSGTPVPVGYPTSQFYVNNADGSVWEYSASAGTWVNTGVPYNVGSAALQTASQQAAASAAAQQATTTPTTATVPVSATIAPDLSTSYQSVLTWLSGTDLGTVIGFPTIPNFAFVLAAGGLWIWLSNRSPAKGRR